MFRSLEMIDIDHGFLPGAITPLVSVDQEETVVFPKSPTVRFVAGLLVAIALGLALVVVAAVFVDNEVALELMLVIGGALITAGVLGASVDAWFKQRLVTDAFKATFGYLLPEVLRGELSWLYRIGLVCTAFNEDITLTMEDGLVIARIRVEREFENLGKKVVSGNDEGVYGALSDFAIDEWGRGGRSSRITDMGYVKGDESSTEFEIVPDSGPHAVVGRLKTEIRLGPGERVRLWVECEEIKALSDEFNLYLRTATCNPRVRIEAPAELSAIAIIASRNASRSHIGSNTFFHQGVLLPYQGITVRWWPTPA